MSLEPRVTYQAEWFNPKVCEWWDVGIAEKKAIDAHKHLRGMIYTPLEARIIKTTTTYEVVEEMEPQT